MWCIPYDRASSWRSYFSLMLWCIWLPFYYPYILSCWCWCYVHANTISGKGVILCIENALADSGVTKEDINYINAHATSTQMGDLKEFEALNCCFGQNPQAILYFRILYFRPSNLLLLLFFWQKKQTSDFLSLVEQTFCLYVLQIRVNSTKSMTGHLLGAAGGIEAVAAIQVRRLM